ncbi:hypothetical protein KCU88_g331, partial [Aureobasidium melanogenum]
LVSQRRCCREWLTVKASPDFPRYGSTCLEARYDHPAREIPFYITALRPPSARPSRTPCYEYIMPVCNPCFSDCVHREICAFALDSFLVLTSSFFFFLASATFSSCFRFKDFFSSSVLGTALKNPSSLDCCAVLTFFCNFWAALRTRSSLKPFSLTRNCTNPSTSGASHLKSHSGSPQVGNIAFWDHVERFDAVVDHTESAIEHAHEMRQSCRYSSSCTSQLLLILAPPKCTHYCNLPPEVVLDFAGFDGIRCLLRDDVVQLCSRLEYWDTGIQEKVIRLIPMAASSGSSCFAKKRRLASRKVTTAQSPVCSASPLARYTGSSFRT